MRLPTRGTAPRSQVRQFMPLFHASPPNIAAAARRLQNGELVAFPTETVYGLGALAREAQAVAKIYRFKGRPAWNPLIVHVADIEAARQVAEWNERAQKLAERFWPGPLTLVLPGKNAVCPAVSAGLSTVAVRVPAHPVALELLRQTSAPLAAPSANRSMQLSPTRAAHVIAGLGKEVWVLDGGECQVGLESTVLDLSGARPAILRPGALGERDLAPLIGDLSAPLASSAPQDEEPRASPGQMARHYAPRAPLRLFSHLTDAHFHAALLGAGKKLGVVALEPTALGAREIILPAQPAAYARQLYAALHELDAAGVELILVERVPVTPQWDAIRDRLERAATA